MIWSVPCGDYTIYAIEDGFAFRDPLEHIPHSTAADWEGQQLKADGRLRLRFGCFLLQTADQRIMVDAGMGKHRSLDFVAGMTPVALETLGIDRDSIEMVIQTHMHFDHIGGTLSAERDAMYPNARHLHHRVEWEHWSKEDSERGEAARWIVEPLLDNGLVEFVDQATAIGDSIEVVETFGHTPGHLSVRVASGTTEVLIGGDLANQPLQVKHPEWTLPVDGDPERTTATRRRVFDELAGTGILFLAGHFPAPGIGVIESEGEGQAFVPVDVGGPIG